MLDKINNLGYMIDVSRGAAPKLESLKQLVDILSSFKYDYLMLYTEDMYEVDDEPYFGYMRGRYSQNELKELDQYCITKKIELIPCIQTLAHLEKILYHHKYSNMFDIDNILLVGNNEVYNLIEKMISSCRKCFTSNKIHLGMDEAHNIGRGKYLDTNGKKDISEIMSFHLDKVNEIAEKYGFNLCYIWGDMFDKEKNSKIKYPECIQSYFWYYHPLGKNINPKIENFKKNCNCKIAFAGSATKYIGFAPANNFSNDVVKEQIKACKKFDIDNYLLTAWGDGASDASMFSVIPCIFLTSCFAKYGKITPELKELFIKVTGMTYKDYLKIDSIVNLDPLIDYKGKWNNIAFMLLYNDPLINLMGDIDDNKYKEEFIVAYKKLKRLSKNKTFGYIFESLSLLAKALSFKANIGNEIYESYHNKSDLTPYIDRLKSFIRYFDKFVTAYENQWFNENKSFGYEKQNIRLGGLKYRTEFIVKQLERYQKKELSQIDELNEKHLKNDLYFRQLEKDTDVVNVYENIVSIGALK